MKIRNLFGMLVVFLLAIGLTNCSDNDERGRYLKLSRNLCEVMRGFSVSIDLIAHENTTLDIENPELIDAVYTWNFDGNKAQIEINGKQKGETSLVVTDHQTGETATLKVKVTGSPIPRLAVERPKANIFDPMSFYLYNEDSKPIMVSDFDDLCDSIVWTVNGMNGSFRVFESKINGGQGGAHLTFEWDHCFIYPADYTTFFTAWKDKKVVFRHQLDLVVTDDNDFLTYNWSDITKDSQAWETYASVFKSDPDLMTTYGLGGTVPFVEVRVFSSNLAQSYDALYNYFCKLYTVPTYEDQTEKQKMWQLYDQLFSEQKQYPNAYPTAIWVTKRANIVLLLIDEPTEESDYVVYAEPNIP